MCQVDFNHRVSFAEMSLLSSAHLKTWLKCTPKSQRPPPVAALGIDLEGMSQKASKLTKRKCSHIDSCPFKEKLRILLHFVVEPLPRMNSGLTTSLRRCTDNLPQAAV